MTDYLCFYRSSLILVVTVFNSKILKMGQWVLAGDAKLAAAGVATGTLHRGQLCPPGCPEESQLLGVL